MDIYDDYTLHRQFNKYASHYVRKRNTTGQISIAQKPVLILVFSIYEVAPARALLASLSPSFVALVGLFPQESCCHGTTGEPEAFAFVHPRQLALEPCWLGTCCSRRELGTSIQTQICENPRISTAPGSVRPGLKRSRFSCSSVSKAAIPGGQS